VRCARSLTCPTTTSPSTSSSTRCSAALARRSGAEAAVVVAALLHDIGRSPAVLADLGHAGGDHGELAERWLSPRVGERVAWLVRQHVPAKRYLRAVEPEYPLTLASERSLRVQGGPMTADEVARFREDPWWREAVDLRRWDDLAKQAGLAVAGLEVYEQQLEEVVARASRDAATGTTRP